MIVKFCMLLETKGPRQQTKFDPQFGVVYGHVTTFTISVKPPYFFNGSILAISVPASQHF